MDKIKIRAWIENDFVKNDVYPYMNYDPEFHGDINTIFSQSGIQPKNTLHNKITYTQYIGLEDKNDKPIYDGDILEVENPDETKFTVLVRKLGAGFALANPKAINTISMEVVPWYIRNSGIIIGNKFENPELI
jgi:hypothetical protein